MSKSIYEEAKRNLISLTAKFVIPSVEETDYGCLYDRSHFYNILDEDEDKYLKNVKQALEQAQKQEKLLELYKRLNSLYEKLYTMELSILSLNRNYYVIEIHKLKEQIKELENETN
ncbi:MAG: hypothetical protein QXN68_02725 [Thermoplasmata archaeon]